MKMREKRIGVLLLLSAFCLLSGVVHGQSQMVLPYVDQIFQSTWENPAVRPMHRFSIGLPVLSSVEAGLIQNGFALKDVMVPRVRHGKAVAGAYDIDLGKVVAAMGKRESALQYSEASVDLLHFRMQWRDWYFWLAGRLTTTQTLGYPRGLFEVLYRGNAAYADGQEHQVRHLGVGLESYYEFTVGFSQVKERYAYGARVSLLTGQASAQTKFDQFTYQQSGLQENENVSMYTMRLVADGAFNTSCLPRDEQGKFEPGQFGTLEYLKQAAVPNMKNPGVALSLGGSYKVWRELELSLAFSDLGLIDWNDQLRTYTYNKVEVPLEPLYTGVPDLIRGKGFSKNQIRAIDPKRLTADTLAKATRYATWLSPKMHFMVTYDILPQTQVGASFSGLYNPYLKSFYPSATLTFQQGYADWVVAQLSYSYNQYSPVNVGAALVLKPGPLQFYVVTDNFLGIIAPKLLRATNVRVGLNIAFGTHYPASKLTFE